MSNRRDSLRKWSVVTAWLALLVLPHLAFAADAGFPAITSTPSPGGGQTYTLSIQTLLFLTALTFLPAILLMMTAFTRIIIVLSLLRQALGTMQSPPNQVLVGLSLFLTFFIMAPVFDRIYTEAYQPYMEKKWSCRARWRKAWNRSRPSCCARRARRIWPCS
jgi:flagellar biosynthetic protein FliP